MSRGEEAATELQSPETILKKKLNDEVKQKLIRNKISCFLQCLEIPDKTAIIINIIYKSDNYYIYFLTKPFVTVDITSFIISPAARVYRDLKFTTPLDERESNLILFLFLLKMSQRSVSEMSEPQKDDVGLFEGDITTLQSFKRYYPAETYSPDDIRVGVLRYIVDKRVQIFEKTSSCTTSGGKTKRKYKRKTKKKSKKRIIKGRGKSWK